MQHLQNKHVQLNLAIMYLDIMNSSILRSFSIPHSNYIEENVFVTPV